MCEWLYDVVRQDTQHDAIRHIDSQHNNTQHNNIHQNDASMITFSITKSKMRHSA